ncbi:MAG: apolipoprotein N-acyltransferase [Myxococcota bacterium]|jgi:apolipoprotein N-acyltransferase
MPLRLLVAVLSGSVLSILAPPANIHLLHWIAYLPMFWALREGETRNNAVLSLCYGTVAVALIFRWLVDTITVFSNIPFLGAVGVLLLFGIVFGLPYSAIWLAVHPLRRRLGHWWVLAIPAWLVVVEWVSAYVLLFPYQQGVTQYRVPLTSQLSSVTGIWGLSFLVMWFNAMLAEGMYRLQEGREWPWGHSAGAMAGLAATLVFGAIRHERVEAVLRDAPQMRIAQLQSDRGMEWRMEHSARAAFREWMDATQALEPGSADLVVWPEGACPYDLNTGRAADWLAEEAKRGGYEMIVGGGTRERERDPELDVDEVRTFNSTYFFTPQGEVGGRYDKMVPLPFGEYLPFAETFPWLADIIEGPGSFRAGESAVVFAGDKARMATPICYEAILGYVCRWYDRPELLVNVTNDAWFGKTAASPLHGMLAAIRAVELGVPLYRSAYTGTSFAAEPHGHIHSETELFDRVHRIVTVRLATFDTIYGRYGDWFVALCAAGLAASMAASRRRSA